MTRHLQRFLVPVVVGILVVVAIASGAALAGHGRFDHPDNLLFEADCSRVIQNSISLSGPQERARIHPLHVLLVAPIGSVLSLVMAGKIATVVITALCAAFVLINLDRVLSQQLGLTLTDRVLFVLLLGASASQVTFAMVPDTHILSALGLSGMASALTPARVELLRGESRGYLPWLRAGGAVPLAWAVLAVGMLGTTLAIVPVLVILLLPARTSWLRRLWFGALGAVSVFAVVIGLHLVQRAIWPPVPVAQTAMSATGPSAAEQVRQPEAPPSGTAPASNGAEGIPVPAPATGGGRLSRLTAYVKNTWMHNARWMTDPGKLPERAGQVAAAMVVNAFLAPRFHTYQRPWSSTRALSFEPWAVDFRLFGGVGAAAWLLLLGSVLVLARTRRGLVAKSPVLMFSACVAVFYALVVGVYGDELFLYSPNWAFAVVLITATLYAIVVASPSNNAKLLRSALTVVVVCLLINSALHTRDVLEHFL
jgi:hypothetical protein